MINLHTGKLIGVATHGDLPVVDSSDPLCDLAGLVDLCFTCGDVTSGTGTVILAGVIPQIGLQATPALAVDHYGPPTSPEAFAGQLFRLKAPSTDPEFVQRPISWSVAEEGIVPTLDIWQGASSGTLQPGTQTTLLIGPKDWVTEAQGLYSAPMPFFDFTYGTRTPMTHRIHVGVDGFTVVPTDPFDGDYDLGVHHGEARPYRAANRWKVDQDLTVTATEDPANPGAPWPQWLRINGQAGPVYVTLPCKGCGRSDPVEASANGVNLPAGTYRGTIVLSSDESGDPPFELAREVYFDHCRDIHIDAAVPEVLTMAPHGGTDTHVFHLAQTAGADISDVDVVLDLAVTDCAGPNTDACRYQSRLRSPDGTEVILKDFLDPPQLVYDDETLRPAAGSLGDFENDTSQGDWTLTVESADDVEEDLELTLSALEIRLHHEDAALCETQP